MAHVMTKKDARTRHQTAATQEMKPPRPHRSRRVMITSTILGIAVLVAASISAAIGQFEVSPIEVFGSINRVVFQGASPQDQQIDAALWTIRFPRTFLALFVGASLAVAGAVMQGVFANPLAEPSIVGVSSGASVGATLAIVSGTLSVSAWFLPLGAFIGAFIATVMVWSFARMGGKTAVLTLVLTGIAINALAAAATSFLIFLGDASSREQVIFWQLGTLSDARWQNVGVIAVIFVLAFTGCIFIRRQLDVLALGDNSAAATGVHVERLRGVAILLVCVLTGTAVAFSGVIAFVGLIVPHALRLVLGPSHRFLIPLSALGGAVLLSLSDIAARTVVPFADLPIGIFTAAVGGPLFLLLLRRTLQGQGGLGR